MNLLNRFDRANAVTHLLDRNVDEGRGGQPALHYDRSVISYGALLNSVSRAGNLFLARGVEWEDRAVLILPDCPEHVVSTLALMRIGAVAVPVSTRLSESDYLYVFADCRPKAAVIGVEHIEKVAKLLESLKRESLPVPRVIWVVGSEGSINGFESFGAGVEGASSHCAVAQTTRDDMAIIQYTSGSTGTPKGVVHLHRGLLEVGPSLVKRLGINQTDVCFSAAKLSFGYGFGNSVLLPFTRGASSVLYSGLSDPFAAYGIIDRYHVTVFFGVPSLYAAMLKVPGSESDFDLSSLKLCVSAGEHLNTGLLTRWRERFGQMIIDGVGCTECLHIFVCGESGRVKAGSTGTPVEGNELKIVDDAGLTVRTGETGELFVNSKANAARYWNKHEETTRTMMGVWMRTGDLFCQDEEGCFYYVGRKDDVIKIGGMKVSPVEVEECLASHEGVRECAVIAATNEDGLSSICAYVCLNPDWEAGSRLKSELRDFVRNSLASYKCPGRIEFVSELPRTSNGKIARYKLRQNKGPVTEV